MLPDIYLVTPKLERALRFVDIGPARAFGIRVVRSRPATPRSSRISR